MIHDETDIEIRCYVDGCTDHDPAEEMTELERAAAWTTWDYVGKD
jgi:hypothetical protein